MTPVEFKARNRFFQARTDPEVQATLDRAALLYDAAVTGEHYDALVESRTRYLLLLDATGGATSRTRESSMAEQELAALERLELCVADHAVVVCD